MKMNNLLTVTCTIFNYNINTIKNSFASFKHEDLEHLGLYVIGGIKVSVGDLVCLIQNAIRHVQVRLGEVHWQEINRVSFAEPMHILGNVAGSIALNPRIFTFSVVCLEP